MFKGDINGDTTVQFFYGSVNTAEGAVVLYMLTTPTSVPQVDHDTKTCSLNEPKIYKSSL